MPEQPKNIGILGDFALLEIIGEGSEGRVYKARCLRDGVGGVALGEIVALKRLKNTGDERESQQFQKQAKILRGLNHPGIIRYRHSFVVPESELGGEVYCLVTEFLDGAMLKALIEANPGGVPWVEVKIIFTQILEALVFANDRQVVHRDLKPSNVFVMANGSTKLIDFGIARQNDPNATSTGSTAGVKGSFDYMAPDFAQMHGNFHGDQQSDIFSFGVCLYHALTGRLPFQPPLNADIMAYAARWHSRTVPEVNYRQAAFRVLTHARTCITGCLSLDRDSRFKSFSEVMAEFSRIAPRKLRSGEVVYEFLSMLGKGGFGEVFGGRRVGDQREVAIKHLFSARHSDRFVREAKILREATHPHLVEYVDFLEVRRQDDVEYYLILEHLGGMPGAGLRDRIKSSTSGLDPLEMLNLFAGYLDCLEHLHRRNIIHRDLKPGNLYAPAGQPEKGKIFDLGIAYDEEGTRTHGQVPGTLEFMPPEFATQEKGRGSPQSDIYSLGVTFYQALTRSLPFPRLPENESEAWIAYFKRSESPTPISFSHAVFSAHPELVPLIRRALAQDPGERYFSAGAMRDEMRALASAWQEYEECVASGESLLADGDFEAAERSLNQALSLKPNGPAAKLLLARAREEKAKNARFRKALTAARSALAAEKFAEAEQYLEQAAALVPQNQEANSLLAEIQAGRNRLTQFLAAMGAAKNALRVEDFSEARKQAELALALRPAAAEPVQCLAEIERGLENQRRFNSAMERALEALKLGDFERAEEQGTIALGVRRDSPAALQLVADARAGTRERNRIRQEQFAAALNAARKALELGELVEAKKQAEIAAALQPDSGEPTKCLADIAKFADRRRQFDSAMAAAVGALERGDFEQAERHGTIALGANVNNPASERLIEEARAARAALKAKAIRDQQFASALEDARRALQSESFTEARRQVKIALELQPNSMPAAQILADIAKREENRLWYDSALRSAESALHSGDFDEAERLAGIALTVKKANHEALELLERINIVRQAKVSLEPEATFRTADPEAETTTSSVFAPPAEVSNQAPSADQGADKTRTTLAFSSKSKPSTPEPEAKVSSPAPSPTSALPKVDLPIAVDPPQLPSAAPRRKIGSGILLGTIAGVLVLGIIGLLVHRPKPPAPIFTLLPPSVVHFDAKAKSVNFKFAMVATNAGMGSLVPTFADAPSGAVVVETESRKEGEKYEWNVTLKRVQKSGGPARLNISVSAQGGGSTNWPVELDLSPPPPPPLITSPSMIELTSTNNVQEFSFTLSDSNTAPEKLESFVEIVPKDLVSTKIEPELDVNTSQRKVILRRKDANNGAAKIYLRARGDGGETTNTIALSVAPLPLPLITEWPSPLLLSPDEDSVSFSFAVLDPHTPMDKLSVVFTNQNEPIAGLTVDSQPADANAGRGAATLSRKPGAGGEGKVWLRVNGYGGETNRPLSYSIQPFRSPAIVAPSDRIIMAAESKSLWFPLSVSDKKTPADELKFSVTNDLPNLAEVALENLGNSNWRVTLSRRSSAGGTGKLLLKAAGRGGESNKSLEYSILPAGLPTLVVRGPVPLVLPPEANSLDLVCEVFDTYIATSNLYVTAKANSDLANVEVLPEQRVVRVSRNGRKAGDIKIEITLVAETNRFVTQTNLVTVKPLPPLPPAFVLLGPATNELTLGTPDLRIPYSVRDPQQLTKEILPPGQTILSGEGVKFEASPNSLGATNGFILITPRPGYIGTADIMISAKANAAAPATTNVHLTIGGRVLPPKIGLQPEVTLELDGATNIPVSVSAEYGFAPEQVDLRLQGDPTNVLIQVDGTEAAKTLRIKTLASGTNDVYLIAKTPNGGATTNVLSVRVLPALGPVISPPADPLPLVVYSGDSFGPKVFTISDNATPADKIRVDWRVVSPNVSDAGFDLQKAVTNGAVSVRLSLPGDSARAGAAQVELLAWDALNHASTNIIKFDFKRADNHFTNSIGMALAWIRGLPNATDGVWFEGRRGGAWVGMFEVKQKEFTGIMGVNPSNNGVSGKDYADFPVQSITYEQATNFCAKLTLVDLLKRGIPEGWHYALPMTNQWRYFSAGAGTTNNAFFARSNPNGRNTSPIKCGTLAPNSFGLYDVFGNVAEFTSTIKQESYPDPKNGADAKRILTGPIILGGDFGTPGDDLLKEEHFVGEPVAKPNLRIGFRVILVPDPHP